MKFSQKRSNPEVMRYGIPKKRRIVDILQPEAFYPVEGNENVSKSASPILIGTKQVVPTKTAQRGLVRKKPHLGNSSSIRSKAADVSKQSLTLSRRTKFNTSKSMLPSFRLPQEEELLREGSGNVMLSDGSTIIREAGSLSAAPAFSTTAHVEYTGTTGVTTGPELPLSTTVLGNLIIDNSGDVTLDADVTVNDSLIFRNGDVITGDNKLTIPLGGVYTGDGDLVGNGQATFAVGTGESGDFNLLGLTIGSSTDDLGNVTVERMAGDAAIVTVGANSSIKCRWDIISDNPPASGRDLTFQWDSSLDNGKDLTHQAQVYKSVDDGASWFAYGLQQDISGSGDPRSIIINTTSFSGWTISDTDNPLPVGLSDFYGESTAKGIKLHWTTESEIENAGFFVYRDGVRLSALIQGSGTTVEPQNYSYLDQDVELGQAYQYHLVDVKEYTLAETTHLPITLVYDYEDTCTIYQTEHVPSVLALHQNYPNPFNPRTTIAFDLPDQVEVNLSIYDMKGHLVKTLIDGSKDAGYYSVTWDGTNDHNQLVSSGVYFYRLKSIYFNEIKSMIMLQ